MSVKRSTRTTGEDAGVLFVTQVGYFGGSAASLRALLRSLDPSIARHLVAPGASPFIDALEREHLVTSVSTFPESDAGRFRRSLTAIRVVVTTLISLWRHHATVEVVHANGLADAICAAPAALLLRRRLVVWVHDDDPSRRRSRHVAAPISRIFGSRVVWVAVSKASQVALVDSGIARADQTTVIGNPIESAGSPPPHHDGPVTVGFFGTDTPRKGFDLLPEVARRLDGFDTTLLIFSRHHTDLDQQYEAIWRELEQGTGVEIVGRLDDVDAGYARCDIVFCPSRVESFCRVAAESMRHGIPVVASDLDPIRELLGDREAGLVFRTGDVDAAAAALRTLAADEDLRRTMGLHGIERAASFDPNRIATEFERLYAGGARPELPRS